MQEGIGAADDVRATTFADRLTDAVGAPKMLSLCIAPGCATILFGRGTCIAHDPPRLPLTAALLDAAAGRAARFAHH